MRKDRNRRRGIAMVIVLVMLATATILGMAYLQSSSVRRLGSANLPAATRAKYLAESGLQHAMHLLRTDLETMVGSSAAAPVGPFFIDGTSSNYRFYAEAVPEELGTYVLRAVGDSGTVQQRCAATVRLAAAPEVTTSFALMVDGELITPAALTVHGDIYATEVVWNYGTIDGNVLSSDWVWDLLSRVTGLKLTLVPPRALPAVSAIDYAEYKLFETPYNRVVVNGLTDLGPSHPLADGGAVTAANPGGVVKVVPDGQLTLKGDLNFQGTLIVIGDIELDGTSIKLNAVDGFPAIICTGKIIARGGAQATINGLVVADGGIGPCHDDHSSQTAIQGGVVSKLVGYHSSLTGTHELTYEPGRCRIYDFSEEAKLPTLEVVRWND